MESSSFRRNLYTPQIVKKGVRTYPHSFLSNLDQYHDELVSLITENFELIPDGWQVPLSS